MINWVPDAIPLSLTSFLYNFYSAFFSWNYFSNLKLLEESDEYYTVYGYSCRSLFDIILSLLHKEDINYAITPIHHTSFKLIIERNIQNENIKIMDLNEKYNEIQKIDFTDINIVIITHLFGQDFDLNYITEQKKKHNFIVLEDRVQGGSVNKPFSHDCVDISFYSMGMDKRPVALGGGFVNIRKDLKVLCHSTVSSINNMKQESNIQRLFTLTKKIPTYLLYNYSSVFYYSSCILNIFNINMCKAINGYRKANPGFDHNDYLLKPSYSLLKSMKNNKQNYKNIEILLQTKYNRFYQSINKTRKDVLVPWTKDTTLTMYNTVYVPLDEDVTFQINLMKNNIPFINNPTWKVLSIAPTKYLDFCNRIYYLPCLYHMNNKEMNILRDTIDKNE